MPDSTPTRRTATPATTARLSFGAPGPSIPVRDHLRFQLDHALARDAVHTPLDTALLLRGLRDRNLTPIPLRSNAPDRTTYLRRPDLGRTLHPDSIAALQSLTDPFTSAGAPHLDSEMWAEAAQKPSAPSVDSDCWGTHAAQPRTLFLLADGLSALALERHALPLLDALPSSLRSTLYPLIPLVQHARVAIADPIGQILCAQITVLLIGERPGLSSPDSLGCYITWNPRPGRTDAERNCISNIRGPEGLSYTEAAHRIAHYLHEAHRLQTTGTNLKDPTTNPSLPHTA